MIYNVTSLHTSSGTSFEHPVKQTPRVIYRSLDSHSSRQSPPRRLEWHLGTPLTHCHKRIASHAAIQTVKHNSSNHSSDVSSRSNIYSSRRSLARLYRRASPVDDLLIRRRRFFKIGRRFIAEILFSDRNRRLLRPNRCPHDSTRLIRRLRTILHNGDRLGRQSSFPFRAFHKHEKTHQENENCATKGKYGQVHAKSEPWF